MRTFLLVCATLTCLLASRIAPLAAENRVALVIGNGSYSGVPALTNPPRDAALIAKALRGSGFTNVTVLDNAPREKLIDALRKFAGEAERADWAVVYYAGHGIEIGGVNYLIPVDAELKVDRDVQFEAIALQQVMTSVEGARKLRLIILDACRDNPFASKMTRSLASRSVGRGLGRVEPEGGILVAYAAKDGQVALDGEGANSPFVTALVSQIETPGLEINRVFRRVRSDVLKTTRNKQEPFIYGSLPDEEFFFRGPSAVPTPPPTALPVVAPPPAPVATQPTRPVAAVEPPAAPVVPPLPAVPVPPPPVVPPPSFAPQPATQPRPAFVPQPPSSTQPPRPVATIAPPPDVAPPAFLPKPTPAPAPTYRPPPQARPRPAPAPRVVNRPVQRPSAGRNCFTFNGQRTCE